MSRFTKLFLIAALLLGVFFVMNAQDAQAGCGYGYGYGYGYGCYTPCYNYYYTPCYTPCYNYFYTPTYWYGGYGCYGW